MCLLLYEKFGGVLGFKHDYKDHKNWLYGTKINKDSSNDLNWQIHSSITSTVVQCRHCGDHFAWMANNILCLANYNLVFHTDQPEASLWSNYCNSDSVFLSVRLFLLCRYLCMHVSESAESNAVVELRF